MEGSSLEQDKQGKFQMQKDVDSQQVSTSLSMEDSSNRDGQYNSNQDIKIPQLSVKKFNFYNPTVSSENKEKSNLRQRLPDFNLTHKTLASNGKFLEKSILPDKSITRHMSSRNTPYSNDRNTITRLPGIARLKRSNSLVYPMASELERKAGSFPRFRAKSENGCKIKVTNATSYEQTTRERKLTPEQNHHDPIPRCWSAEDLCQGTSSVVSESSLMEVDNGQGPHVDVSHVDSTLSERRPIERFQKIVRLLCFLLKIKTSTDRKYKQEQYTGVFEQLDELTETVVNDDGMVFDPNYFKAVKEVKLSQDAVQILSMVPGTRTEEQLQAALVGLKASVAAFGEYPLKMQRRLVSVGWYESFEAKRVIIRQGHRAENFYFILSGTALVTLLVNDPGTGEERSTTVAVLGKGCSFGELALLHHKTRSATVLCRNEVALLAVGREDFRDIFMSYEDGKEPEHVQFLRGIAYIKDLPLDQCSTRPDICIFHYFRRGVVIVKDSKTEWIYIIKSGSCRVLTNLVKRKVSLQTCKSKRNIYSLPAIPVDEHERRKILYTVASGDRMHDRCHWFPETKRPRTEPNTRTLTLPAISTPAQDKFQKTVKKVNFALPWLERLNRDYDSQAEVEAHREKIQTLHRQLTSCSVGKTKTPTSIKNKNDNSEKAAEHVCVQIELIKPKDQFGLASILYDNEAVKCHLVSNGAECILIKKSWVLQNADETLLRDLRGQIPPYPTQERLEQKFQDQANWESFKSQTINDLLDTLQL